MRHRFSAILMSPLGTQWRRAICVVAVASALGLVNCAGAPVPPPAKLLSKTPPILFVHGMNDTHNKWDAILERVLSEGATHIRAMDYTPNNGSASIVELAKQVDAEAKVLLEKTGAEKIDIVAMSLGTQVVRYWMLKSDGLAKVRKVVAISGPFSGTEWAHLGFGPVIEELTPGSDFLADLEKRPHAPVELTVICTPYDGVIVPASSCFYDKANAKHSIPVMLHPTMYLDTRVHDAIVETLAKDSE